MGDSPIFKRNIEGALGEPIEETRARPLDPRAELDAGRFGNPPQMMVGCYNPRTGRYTNNLREIFPDANKAYEEAIWIPWYERVLRFFYR